MPLDRLIDVDGIEEGHVKARQPHVHHDRDFEIGLGLLELAVQLLAVVLAADQIVERLRVVLAPRHHHLDALHRLDLLLICLAQLHALRADFDLRPFGAQRDHCL